MSKKKPLGTTIDRSLDFDEHMLNQCKSDGRKQIALTKLYKFMSLELSGILKKLLLNHNLNITHVLGCFAEAFQMIV